MLVILCAMKHKRADVFEELAAHRKSSVDLLNEAWNKAIDADIGRLLNPSAGIRKAVKWSDVARSDYEFMRKDLKDFYRIRLNIDVYEYPQSLVFEFARGS